MMDAASTISESNRISLSPKPLGFILQNGKLTIQDFESICPDVNRRSLQRDLKGVLDKGLVISEGTTNQLVYILRI